MVEPRMLSIVRHPAAAVVMIVFFALAINAQRVAIVAPERTAYDLTYLNDLSRHFHSPLKALDDGMVSTAFGSAAIQTPFNMSISDARRAATVIGCDYLLIVRAGEQRRTSFSRPEYYESFAFLYFIDGRSGNLISWRRSSFDGPTQADASRALSESVGPTAGLLFKQISEHRTSPKASPVAIEEVPSDGSPEAAGLKPPLPYRRLKPEYTELAFLYDIRATIDVETDIGPDGAVLGLRFVRWAGFGLEESVEKAVRQMNWRPAARNGKPLPMRILLRYNFTKVDKE